MKISAEVLQPLSSKIDWCEPNYVVTVLIAEFWNTISNLPMMVLPICLMYLYKDYSKNVPSCQISNVVWMLLAVTGIGSVYFHSTLSLFGQFLDEMGILWICCTVAAAWMPDTYVPKCFVGNRFIYQIFVLCGAIVATSLSFIKPEINHWFLFLFALPAMYMLSTQKKLYKQVFEFQDLSRNAFTCWILAICCWVLDRFLCPLWLQLRFPIFHGVWHILVTLASYKICVCFSYFYAQQEKSDKRPVLKFYIVHPSLKWCGLWYVGFVDEAGPFHQI